MPIYEFYCPDCHTIFSFFSLRVDTATRPKCPRCSRPEIERQASVFSFSRGLREEDDDEIGNLDESRMEKAMAMLAEDAGAMDEDDPRQAAKLMRKLSETAGMELGPAMEEAMRRMESGEDPDQIEAELGDALEQEDPFTFSSAGRGRARRLAPERDETLYDL